MDATFYGVDIHSGSPRGDSQSYALVRLRVEGGEERAVEYDVVSQRKLLRSIADETPDVVATDNVFELAEDKNDLVNLLRNLPSGTNLVQVTGAEQPEPLSRVAARHDVPYGKKPSKEAEASARLAARNVGHRVRAFDDSTRVKVSRGRSTGSGGFSEDRYTRKIHGAVRTRAREVESLLKDEGFSYTVEATEKYGGYSNAVFDVDAAADELPVSSERSGDVRVEVEQPRRDGLEFEPLVKRRDHVFVGVDPGTTTAVAVVDLDGEVLESVSSRELATSDVVEWIVERGRPVVVASDVTPMPDGVEKVLRSFDARRWTPDTDLDVRVKKEAAAGSGCGDDHQRDAAAAAVLAYQEFSDVVERAREGAPTQLDGDEVAARVVRGERDVASVVEEMQVERDGDGDGDGDGPSAEEKEINRLEQRVGRLTQELEEMREKLDSRNQEIDELEREMEAERGKARQEVREAEEVRRLIEENERLKRKLERSRNREEELESRLTRLKKLWKVEYSDLSGAKDGFTVVKVVEEFTGSALDRAEESFGLAEDDVVMLLDAGGAGRSTAEHLAAVDPGLVLVGNGGLSDAADTVLFEHDVPVADADTVPTRRVDDLALARESDVEDAVEGWRERARERRRRRDQEMVDDLISEYRYERRRKGGS